MGRNTQDKLVQEPTCTTAITHRVRERKKPNTEVTAKRENKSVQSKPFLREFIKLGSERHSSEFFLAPQMLKARAGDRACNFSAAFSYFKWGVSGETESIRRPDSRW